MYPFIPGWRISPQAAFVGGSSLDPATTAWISAVTTAGGTVSGTQQTRVDTLIKALKGHSLFTKLDRVWLWGGESDHHQATIDIINLAVGIENGNLTSTGLSASGYTSNGSTGYFDTNFVMSTGPNCTNASANSGYYITTAASVGGAASGCSDVGSGITLSLNPNNFGSAQFVINNNFISTAVTSSNGMWIGNQLSGTETIYNFSTANSTSGSIASGASASPLVPTSAKFFYCAFNSSSSGVPSSFMPDTLAAGFLGAGLSSTDVTHFSSDLNAYMTAWGINQF